jgi:hypothetical protein
MSPASSVALPSRLKGCDLYQRIMVNSFSLNVSAATDFPLEKNIEKYTIFTGNT